uniref:Lytic transglycosylase domain-containing protein n=1 Tax=Desulfobacca acetoxidans TaxID=60893 RepID=A0A7C3Z2U0_9BACT
MLAQPILNSFSALVFFLCGGLGSPNLPSLPPAQQPLLKAAAPALAPEQLGHRTVELTQRLEPVATLEIPRELLQMVFMSDPKLRARIELLIKKYAKQNRIDEKLVRAVLHKESGGNPTAVSPKGAMGLMQLMPETAASLGVENPFDVEQNVAGGVKYLKYCLDRFNQDIVLALAAYNAGPEAVKKYGGVPPYRETEQYVAGITGLPVEDVKNKNIPPEERKTQGGKPDSRQADRVPKPAWNIVRAEITVPAPKWKIQPLATPLSSTPVKDEVASGETVRVTRNYSALTEDGKKAGNPGHIAIPSFFKKSQSW